MLHFLDILKKGYMENGYFRMVEKIWVELYTLIFDGNGIFDVVIATGKNGLEMGKFLSLLASRYFHLSQGGTHT